MSDLRFHQKIVERIMNITTVRAFALVLLTASPALATPGITEGFGGVFTWVFCGYCAIIILAQAGAAISSLLGQTRKKPEQEAAGSQQA